MKAEKVISYLLNNAVAVTTIVGTRIWGGGAPKGALEPLVVYAKQGADRSPYLNPTDGITVTARVDVLLVAKTYPQLKSLAEAVRISIPYNSGMIAGVEVIETIEPEEGADEYDADFEVYAQLWAFTVVHMESSSS